MIHYIETTLPGYFDGNPPHEVTFRIQDVLAERGLDLAWDDVSRGYRDLKDGKLVGMDIPLTPLQMIPAVDRFSTGLRTHDTASINMDPPTCDKVDSSPYLPLFALEPIASSDLLRVEGRLGRHKVRVLIDGGARGNFVSLGVVKAANLQTLKDDSFEVTMADGWKSPAVIAPNCHLKIKHYDIDLDLLATDIAHDVILGKAWLEKVNLIIDWKLNTLSFHDEKGQLHE